MIFTLPCTYMQTCNWFLKNVSTNEALCAVFVMWLNTEITYALVVSFFYYIEQSGKFTKYKIHEQPSDGKMFRDAILFKPVTWLVDVPIYFMSYKMMGWRILDFGVDKNKPMPSPLDPLPDATTLFCHVVVLVLVFDFLFYCWHRALHTKILWKYHKKHHEVKVSFSCANDHEDPVELAGNILWKMVPPALMCCHVYTVCVFRAIVKFFALLHHSGFELPAFQFIQLIPGIASPAGHDFHHYYGKGNYGGVFKVWDRIFGTEKCVDVLTKKMK